MGAGVVARLGLRELRADEIHVLSEAAQLEPDEALVHALPDEMLRHGRVLARDDRAGDGAELRVKAADKARQVEGAGRACGRRLRCPVREDPRPELAGGGGEELVRRQLVLESLLLLRVAQEETEERLLDRIDGTEGDLRVHRVA